MINIALNFNKILEKKYFSYILWAIIIIYPFLFLWQGLNFSDEGNILTIYNLIFNNPQSISDTFGTWGANIIGGIWLLLFGKFGLIGIRFAGALVSLLTLFFVYFIFKEFIEKKILLFGLLISFLFSYHFLTLTILGYNNLSILFFTISIFCLINGLKNNNNKLLFMAGFILSFNIFVRLPNILGLLLISAISLSAYIKKDISVKARLKQYFVFTAGILFNIAAVAFAMKFLGHDIYYIESIKYLMGATQINHGPYGGLFFIALKGFFNLFIDAVIMFFLVLLAIFMYLYMKLDRLNIFIKLSSLLFFIFLLYSKYNFIGIPIGGRIASLLIGICYATLVMCILNSKNDKNLRIAAFLILVLFIIIPLGSGAGQINSLYVIPIAFPIAANYINSIKKINFFSNIFNYKIFKNISLVVSDEIFKKTKIFIIISFILYIITNAFAFSYDDAYNRFSLNTGINHKYLKGIYTTKEKAEPLNELILELPKYVRRGDVLFVAWIAPIIYYLTETVPYFPHPWTEIYSRDQIIRFLSNKNAKLPVIVRYNHLKNHEYDDILYNFLQNNFYKKKWNNAVYEIYAPINNIDYQLK